MEAEFPDDLRRLTNALRYEGFRFILIGHNRHSLYVDIAKQLRTTSADRPVLELRLRDKPYRQIVDEILAFPNGIILIPDFDWLLQPGNETIRVAFNQRRDAFARRNVAFICFIGPDSWRSLAEKLPDWWSLRSLELNFERETADINMEFLPANEETSSLGGETKEEKEAEIERLIKQLEAVKPDNKLLLRSLYDQIGLLSFQVFAFQKAFQYWKLSLGISREIGDKSGEGRSLNNIAQVFDALGDYEAELTHLQQSLIIRKQIGDKSGESTTLNNLALLFHNLGDYEVALSYFQQSLSIKQLIGDKNGESRTLNHIAQIYKEQGNDEMALDYLKRSLNISEQNKNRREEGVTINNVAQIYKDRGDYEIALSYLQKSLNISREIGDKTGEGTILNNLGTLAYTINDYDAALLYFQQSLKIEQQVGEKRWKSTTLNNIAQIYKDKGDYQRALSYLQESLNIHRQIRDQNGLAMTFYNMGTIYFEQLKDLKKAVTFFFYSFDLFLQIDSPNTNLPQSYLGTIEKQIGEARFQEILQSIPNDPSVNNL
jgi:tetratricopeptide (TPR) repeat protein